MKTNVRALLILCGIFLLIQSSFGEDGVTKSASTFQIDTSGHVRVDGIFKESGDFQDNLRLKATDLKIKAGTDQVKLNLMFELNEDLRKNGEDVLRSSFSSDRFVKELYVSIKAAENLLIKAGKHEIAFGQDYNAIPIYHDNPTHGISEYNQVFGVTAALNTKTFTNLIDSVEVSGFETGRNNLKIDTDKLDGISARLTKEVIEKTVMEASYMHLGNGNGDSENRGSLGIISHLDDNWTAWAEGLYFDGFSGLPDVNYGWTGGVSRKLGPGEVVVECTRIQDSKTEEAVGYKCWITPNLMLGVQVSFVQNDNRRDDIVPAFRLEIPFGKGQEHKGQTLFGNP